MLKIDIVIPPFSSSPKYVNNIFTKSRMNNHWFPIWFNQRNLINMGIKVKFINFQNYNPKKASGIVGLDCRVFESFNYRISYERKKNLIVSYVKNLKEKVDQLLWFDTADSTGTTQFEVLPYVDKYLKKQLLKNLSLYYQNYYESRFFTDFYVRKYILKKKQDDIDFTNRTKLNPIFINKLDLSWNLAYSDFRYLNILNNFIFGFLNRNKLKYFEPSKNRNLRLSANFGFNYPSLAISFQRKEFLKILLHSFSSNDQISLGRIPKKYYLKNLSLSKAVLSPFGWGEICYRDFETFLAGAALIKPDMDHLKTWPDVFRKNKTYIPLSWKIEDFKESLQKILESENLLYKIAQKGQGLYKKLWGEYGIKRFCKHFINLVESN